MQTIQFKRNGKIIIARVMSRDSDETAAIWAVDVENCDMDYMVQPNEVI